ncbi:MAG: ribosome biogenesis GTP-binding protein YihA/YsxC [Eubacterium sp.]|nr:ribosome biogenesis GTP-binding protein YihA/YsxC [Eubacterium sp.]
MKIKDLELETVCGIKSDLPVKSFPEVAFWGRSNAGKSSLLNTLWGRKSMARTSSQPGKTQTINYYRAEFSEDNDINQNPLTLYMVDLPGYGYAKISKKVSEAWEGMTLKYLKESEMLRGVFLLTDSRHEPQASDIERFSILFRLGFDPFIVATKVDKLKTNQKNKNIATISRTYTQIAKDLCKASGDDVAEGFRVPVIPFSSVTGEGKEEVWECLANFAKS